MHVVFANFFTAIFNPENWLTYGKVALALGTVVFVHELGHFVVAKLCGVKCEKFYIGFDIGGWKLFHFQWGETEYGIGILPLGGYVKMLGQDDNPAKAAAEIERAKVPSTGDNKSAADAAPVFDPRSYQAQSVPERMAIISAGVIMNVIFAFIMASWAYGLGVEYTTCGVSAVIPGEAAWKAGIRPGDEILQIGDNDQAHLKYADLMAGVVFSSKEGVRLKIRRPGIAEPFWLTAKPDAATSKAVGRPRIGASPPASTQLYEKEPVAQFSPAAATEKLLGGDRIVRVGDVPIADYAGLHSQIALHPNEPLTIQVEREIKPDSKVPLSDKEPKPPVQHETVSITIPRNPLRHLGLSMEVGEITAIENDSPAEKAGLRVGDKLSKINDTTDWNPLFLPEVLRQRAAAGKMDVDLVVQRTDVGGKNKETQEVTLKSSLRLPTWYEESALKNSPVTIPAIGVAYRVSNRVKLVDASGPAGKMIDEKQRIVPGDEIIQAQFILSKEHAKDTELEALQKPIVIDGVQNGWPHFQFLLQKVPPNTNVKLTVTHKGSDNKTEQREIELTPVESAEFSEPFRGFVFKSPTKIQTAESFGEALQLGWRETTHDLTMVYRFLQRVFTGELSPTNFGGPIQIIDVASQQAEAGFVPLIMFLVMISANLAVVNFLPIPVLDGGHMVFLLYEGIRGKPPGEKFMTVMLFIGLAIILTLMIFTFGLDLMKKFGLFGN